MKQDIEYAVPLFKAGAEWRINSVWHDAREKPDKGKLLIVEDIDSAYDLVYFFNQEQAMGRTFGKESLYALGIHRRLAPMQRRRGRG